MIREMENRVVPDEKSEELTRFQKLARALFRVDKCEIPKHEPKKRISPDRQIPPEEP